MKYKQIIKKGYNLYIIPTTKFTTHQIELKFVIPALKEDMTKLSVLTGYMYKANKKYPTFRDLVLESETNFMLSFNIGFDTEGSNFLFGNSVTFLNAKYTSKEVFNNTIDFLFNSVLNVSFDDNEHNNTQLKVVLNKKHKDILQIKDDRKQYSRIRFFETFFPNSPMSYRQVGYKEDLDKITLESLKEYYDYIINEGQVNIFATGDIEEAYLTNLIDEWLDNRINKSHPFDFNSFKDNIEPVVVKEPLISNQSDLHLGLLIEDMTTKEEFAVLPILSYVLGGNSNSLLFSTVREKHSLCYTVYARGDRFYKFIHIYAGINALNYDKTKGLIMNEIENMKNKSYEDDLIENAKKTMINNFKLIEDNKNDLIGYLESRVYFNSLPIEERLKLINTVTKEDIAILINKFKLDTIYFLEGVDAGE